MNGTDEGAPTVLSISHGKSVTMLSRSYDIWLKDGKKKHWVAVKQSRGGYLQRLDLLMENGWWGGSLTWQSNWCSASFKPRALEHFRVYVSRNKGENGLRTDKIPVRPAANAVRTFQRVSVFSHNLKKKKITWLHFKKLYYLTSCRFLWHQLRKLSESVFGFQVFESLHPYLIGYLYLFIFFTTRNILFQTETPFVCF